MNKELLEAMEVLEKEKNISKETLLEAIENSLLTACKNHFGKADNVRVNINPDTCDFAVYMEKEVVETSGGRSAADQPGGRQDDEPQVRGGGYGADSAGFQEIRAHCHAERQERDPAEDPRGRAHPRFTRNTI